MMKMMMICDPYEKTMDYLWFDESEGKYIDMSERSDIFSELTNAKYTRDVTLQSRADEIVKIIDNLDPSDLGIEVHFIGTQDDFDDLKRVVELFYESKNIFCIKEPPFFLDAEYALSNIKTRFSEVEGILSEYKEDAIVELLNSYEKTIKPDLAICIMGLYSAGKSAFINSLVGAELLPSASDPTTAKVCKIQCRDSYTISVYVNGCQYSVNFDSDIPVIAGENDEVKAMIQAQIQNGKDTIAKMYHYLKFLNANRPFGEMFNDGELITVTLPYVNTLLPTDKFDFVIYDTPGSNSASNREHFRVLNEALTVQTNALPIILTTPDTMDNTDNDALLNLLHTHESKLDTTNGLIVINKADDKGPRSLGEKRDKIDGLKLTKWKSTRIFFVSSILGLASKKENPHEESSWFDLDTFEIFEKNSSLYESDERKLYTFNIIDRSRQFDYELTEQDGVNTLLLYNSGLASIELELANYARRYAQYVKCHEAIRYLKTASDKCAENVRNIEAAQTDALAKATREFEEKKKQIVDSMSVQRKAVVSKAADFFRMEVLKVYEEFKARNKIYTTFGTRSNSSIYVDFQQKWNSLKAVAIANGGDEKQALQQMQTYVTEQLNNLLNAVSAETNCENEAFWETRTTVFQKILRTIITDSKKLNQAQKKILDAVVLDMSDMETERVEFDLREHKGIRMGIIPFIPIGKENYNNSGCCRNFLAEFERLVKERIEAVKNQNTEVFDNWCGKVISSVSEKISTFNEELREAERKIAALQKDVDEKKSHAQLLQETTQYIESLLQMQKPAPQAEERAAEAESEVS
ncbi:MAG: dynamin family protein [Oscillospiraceae bacterium]|nr:dynamin family protein [Oscillospiraceae bacterium]